MSVVVREATLEEVVKLSMSIDEFPSPPGLNEYEKRLAGVRNILLIAEVNGAPGGFKVGYDRHLDGEVFYSWMGGVRKEYRRLGLASLLLEKMEFWCLEAGFTRLQFKTRNSHSKMISFAYSRGFWLIDFQKKEKVEDSRLLFEKELR